MDSNEVNQSISYLIQEYDNTQDSHEKHLIAEDLYEMLLCYGDKISEANAAIIDDIRKVNKIKDF